MLDNLSEENSSPFFQNADDKLPDAEYSGSEINTNNQRKGSKKFLGLKSQQLFILLLMLLIVVGLLGTMILLVTGKIVPTIL